MAPRRGRRAAWQQLEKLPNPTVARRPLGPDHSSTMHPQGARGECSLTGNLEVAQMHSH